MSHRARPLPIAIVGGGVAGGSAASALREAGHRGRIILVSDECALPYRRSPLTKAYLRGEIGRDELLIHPATWYRDAGIDLLLGARATAVDRRRREIAVQGHGLLRYDRLLLATGVEYGSPVLPGALRIRTVADAERLRRLASPSTHVTVVGAGYIGSELASSLAVMGVRVTLIERRPWPLPGLGAGAGGWLAERARDAGIELRTDAAVLGVAASRGRRLVYTASGVIETDLVVDARGRLPSTGLAAGAGLAAGTDGDIVEATGQTGDARVAVAGDGAGLLGRYPPDRPRDEVSAARLGTAAARALLGLASPAPEIPLRSAEVFGETMAVLGRPEAADAVIPLSAAPGVHAWAYGRAARIVAAAGPQGWPGLEALRGPIREGLPFPDAVARATRPADYPPGEVA